MNDKLQVDRMQRVEKRERHVSKWKANAPVALELSLARPTRFDVDDPRLLAHLDEHGYAVVAAVATPSNLTEASDLLWDWLGDAASWTRGSPETWTDSSFRAIGDPSRGLVRTSSAIPHLVLPSLVARLMHVEVKVVVEGVVTVDAVEATGQRKWIWALAARVVHTNASSCEARIRGHLEDRRSHHFLRRRQHLPPCSPGEALHENDGWLVAC